MVSHLKSRVLQNILFFLALALIAALAGVTFNAFDQGRQQADLVRHTYQVIATSKSMQAAINHANSAHRGYVITGNPTFLDPLNQIESDSNMMFARLRQLTQDNAEQQVRIEKLEALFRSKYRQMRNAGALRRSEGREAAWEYVNSGEGKRLMDSIHLISNEIDRAELRLLQEREAEAGNALSEVRTTLLVGTAASLTIIVLTFVALQRENRRRRKGEEELFIKNEWFTQTLYSLGDGVITTDTEGFITTMNRAASEITKWKEEDARGKHINDVFQITAESSGQTVINPAIDAMQRNEIAFLASSTILHQKDGQKVIIDDSGAPIHDWNGNITGAVLIFRDVTDKRRAERELGVFHELSPDLIGIANPEGRFTRVNPSFAKTLGYPTSNFLADQFLNFVHPDDQVETNVAFARLNTGKTVRNFVNRYRCAEGNYRWLEWNAIALDGVIYATARDITDSHEASEKLKSAYQQFYQILETNPVAILISDVDSGKIKYVNDSFCGMLGLERDQVVARYARDLDQFNNRECQKIRNSIIRAGGRKRNLESVIRSGNKDVDVLFSVESLDIDNEACYVSSFVDISQRKRAEREVKSMNEMLERRVEERTAEIQKQKDFTDEILNKIPIEIAVYDRDRKYLFVNPAGMADAEVRSWLIGKTDAEYVGRFGMDNYVSPDRFRGFDRVDRNEAAEWVDEIPTDDGTSRYMLRILLPLSSNHYILTGIDITEIKIAEYQKQQHIDDLEEMMFITSHKVRHPVAQIVSLAMLLNEDLTQEELSQIVSYTKDSIDSLDLFTRELTMFIHNIRQKNSEGQKTQ